MLRVCPTAQLLNYKPVIKTAGGQNCKPKYFKSPFQISILIRDFVIFYSKSRFWYILVTVMMFTNFN